MILIAAIVFVLDRLMKVWAYDVLRELPGGTRALWENVLQLTYAENRGMSFGLFSGNSELISTLSIALCLFLFIVLIAARNRAPIGLRLLGWALLGGALGNLYDRLRFGFVIDMFEIRLFRFAIFNVADAFLCVSVAFVALYILFGKPGVAQKS
ncbi:MAG: signal peptidase II [Oscillospiraceae bacterium]|jgi:signal peptidase II|nr:signal peptidase II [Oscillospiraceae bacterium]